MNGCQNWFLEVYYVPINVISLDTFDFKECDEVMRTKTLWFSESISPLSETEEVVHNVYGTVQNMYQVHYLLQNETYNFYP